MQNPSPFLAHTEWAYSIDYDYYYILVRETVAPGTQKDKPKKKREENEDLCSVDVNY